MRCGLARHCINVNLPALSSSIFTPVAFQHFLHLSPSLFTQVDVQLEPAASPAGARCKPLVDNFGNGFFTKYGRKIPLALVLNGGFAGLYYTSGGD